MRSNEHIDWFKRFAAAYLRWSHMNMDRIVSDAVKRDRSTPTTKENNHEKTKTKEA